MSSYDSKRFGRYELLGEIGRGGMGIVYRARHSARAEVFALKVTNSMGPRARARFQREARALAIVKHRNVIQVSDFGEHSGRAFFAMELIDGCDLEAYVKQSIKESGEVPPFDWTCRVFKELVEGVIAYQAQGLIHRDLKPGNILIEEGTWRPVIIDFGLVKRSTGRLKLDSHSEALSQTGELIGTVAFMAPEQADCEEFGKVSYRTDIWSLGATLFYCLTGRAPFIGATAINIFKQLLEREIPTVRSLNPSVSVALEEIVAGCLIKEDKRFDLETLLDRLNSIDAKNSGVAGPKKATYGLRALAVIGVVLGCLLASVLLFRMLTAPVQSKITSHKNGDHCNLSSLVIRGQTLANALIKVSGTGKVRRASDSGRFSIPLILTEGKNDVQLDIESGLRSGKCQLSLILDTRKPVIVIDDESYSIVKLEGAAELTGALREKYPAHLTVNGRSVSVNGGRFRFPITQSKETGYKLLARDKAGNITLRKVNVTTNGNILKDRLKWNKADQVIQDLLIRQVDKDLGEGYRWVETKDYICNGQKHRIATFRHVKSGIEMNLIPGGSYQMGSRLDSREIPVHKVAIEPMLVGRYEVTQAQWLRIDGQNPSAFKGLDKPVDQVSWSDCQGWLNKVNDRGARSPLRLPSESEWESVCRSGTTTKYFWGDEMDGSYCWYKANSGGRTHGAAEHIDKYNAFGLVDMSGNVWEWCLDNYRINYKDGPKDSRPRLGNQLERVFRGGHWNFEAFACRSGYRGFYKFSVRSSSVGFRVFRSYP